MGEGDRGHRRWMRERDGGRGGGGGGGGGTPMTSFSFLAIRQSCECSSSALRVD